MEIAWLLGEEDW